MNAKINILETTKEINILFIKFLMVFVICFAVIPLQAMNYTIQSGEELELVNNTLLPGDTVFMKSGSWVDQEINFVAQGQVGQSIVLIAEKKGEVVISGESKLNIYGSYLEVNGLRFENGFLNSGAIISFRKSSSELSDNCRLTNTTIKNYNPTNKDTDYKWVSVYGSNNRVDHCSFVGKEHSGTTLVVWIGDAPNNTQIDHNYFGARPDLGYNGGETIRIGTSTNSMQESRAVVEYNVFEACDGEIEIISNKSCFNTYRYNTFRDCDGCLTLRHGNDCSVYSNFFFGEDKASGGVRIIGERHQVYNNYFQGLKGDDYRSAICIMNGVANSPLNRYFQVKDAVVVFNTIVDCKVPLIVGAGKDSEKTLAPLNCTFANNVMDKTSGGQNVVIEDQPINMTWLANVMHATPDEEDVNEGFIFADPSFKEAEDIYRPTSSSILIDASKGDYQYADEDVDGQAREGVSDVGCDEQSEATIVNSPMDKSEVGPYSGFNGDVSISKVRLSSQEEMVKCHIENETLSFSVEQVKYLPINYMIFDISGNLISKGKIIENPSSVKIHHANRMLLAYFISSNKYYQSQKLLQNRAI